ncbi:hypothetical protein RvY_14514 [Ramazzottius varieornatus]|uniref:Uncharacterized protein n=1 Tax=Ramazzottius varieornatus TaxID=947166 RepID=A0A1D1VRL1_RAMVA|nr:hypothetical protein RvY_14514 [Ramazzottius varieornatus]
MFLAIINETYSVVKEDLASKPNDFEITDYLKRGFNRVLRALHIRRLQRWQKKTSMKFFVEDKALKQKAQMELEKWEDDLKHRGYTDEEIVEVFGKTSSSEPFPEGESDEQTQTGTSENVVELERRVKKLEAALTAILGHFDSSLAKLEVMEKAKQSRDKKLDVIIDNLDGVSL